MFKKCIICGHEFKGKPCKLRKRKFCSQACHYRDMTGRKPDLETRQKLSKALKGRIPWNKGLKNCFTEEQLESMRIPKRGKKHTLEERLKISKAHLGAKSHNWKGGITPLNHKIRNSIETRFWREAIFERDNWTCQDCGKRGGIELNAHHLKQFSEYPELRFSVENGITLCVECHWKRHTP